MSKKNKKSTIAAVLGVLVTLAIGWWVSKLIIKEPVVVEEKVTAPPSVYDTCIEIKGKIDCRRCVDNNCKPIEDFYPNIQVAEKDEVGVGITDFELISQYKYSDIVYSIYKLESEGGTRDGCKNVAQGMFNGFGFRDDMVNNKWRCFNTFEEAVRVVSNWFDTQFRRGLNQQQAICLYGTGRIMSSCDYFEKYVSIGGVVYGSGVLNDMLKNPEKWGDK